MGPTLLVHFVRICSSAGVAHVTFHFQMNSLNLDVMAEMKDVFDQVQSRPDIQAGVLISGKPGCFIAGADIKMLEA